MEIRGLARWSRRTASNSSDSQYWGLLGFYPSTQCVCDEHWLSWSRLNSRCGDTPFLFLPLSDITEVVWFVWRDNLLALPVAYCRVST